MMKDMKFSALAVVAAVSACVLAGCSKGLGDGYLKTEEYKITYKTQPSDSLRDSLKVAVEKTNAQMDSVFIPTADSIQMLYCTYLATNLNARISEAAMDSFKTDSAVLQWNYEWHRNDDTYHGYVKVDFSKLDTE